MPTRLTPTLTCGGPGGSCGNGETRKNGGWGGWKAHAVTGQSPGCPFCADDSYASGRGSSAASCITVLRDDCPDHHHAEGSLCR